MNYPHWFTFLRDGTETIPVAVMLISQSQAECAIERYASVKNLVWDWQYFVKYDNLEMLRAAEASADDRLIVLTDDPRGKCIAYQPCNQPGGRCHIEYYECGDCNI